MRSAVVKLVCSKGQAPSELKSVLQHWHYARFSTRSYAGCPRGATGASLFTPNGSTRPFAVYQRGKPQQARCYENTPGDKEIQIQQLEQKLAEMEKENAVLEARSLATNQVNQEIIAPLIATLKGIAPTTTTDGSIQSLPSHVDSLMPTSTSPASLYDYPTIEAEIRFRMQRAAQKIQGYGFVGGIGVSVESVFAAFFSVHHKPLLDFLQGDDKVQQRGFAATKPELGRICIPSYNNIPLFLLDGLTDANRTPSSNPKEASGANCVYFSDPEEILGGLRNIPAREPRMLDLAGSSGSGKTRLLLEALHKEFGVYFSAGLKAGFSGQDVPYSGDVKRAVDYSTANSRYRWYENEAIVRFFMQCLLLSRLKIMLECFELAEGIAEGNPRTEAKAYFNPQKWFLLQICFRFLEKPMDDLFRHLFVFLTGCPSRDIEMGLKKAVGEILKRTRQNHLPVYLDEAQLLLSSERQYYSYTKECVCRPILTPILRTLFNPWMGSRGPFGVVVTGSSMTLKRQVEVSALHYEKKTTIEASVLITKGWDTLEQVKEFACRFGQITPEQALRLYQRFQGRYRPLVTVLSDLLMTTPDKADGIIQRSWNRMVKGKGELSLQKSFDKIWQKLKDISEPHGTDWRQEFVDRLFEFRFLASRTEMSDQDLDFLVEYGYARFAPENGSNRSVIRTRLGESAPVVMHEGTAVAVAFDKLQNDPKYKSYFTRRLNQFLRTSSSPQSLGKNFEFAVLPLLHKWLEKQFRDGKSLGQLPNFKTFDAKSAEFFGRGPGNKSYTRARLRPREPISYLVKPSCDSYDLVDYLLDHPDDRPISFMPDNRSGSGAIFWIEFEDSKGHVFLVPVFMQMKTGKRLGSGGMSKAWESTSPSKVIARARDLAKVKWSKVSEPEKKRLEEKLEGILAQMSSSHVRILITYFNSGGKKVDSREELDVDWHPESMHGVAEGFTGLTREGSRLFLAGFLNNEFLKDLGGDELIAGLNKFKNKDNPSE